MQHLRILRTSGVQGGGRRQPVIARMAPFFVTALTDGVDEIVFEDVVAEDGAMVDDVTGALGFAAVEGLQGRVVDQGAALHTFKDRCKFRVHLIYLRGGKEASEDYGTVFLPELENLVKGSVSSDYPQLFMAVGDRDLRGVGWNPPHRE